MLLALIAMGLWPKPLPVETATVTRGPLSVTVNEEGMTEVRNRYVISSPVSGQLKRIPLKPGAVVEAGKTIVALLETKEADLLDASAEAQAKARVKGAEASRELAAAQRTRADAAAKQAKTDYERLRALLDAGSTSRQETDTAETRAIISQQEARAAVFAFQVAEFEVTQAKAFLQRGRSAGEREQSEPVTLTSPVSGRVLRVFQESARVVAAGLPLLEVGDPTDIEARIEVLSRDGVAIQPGAPVSLELWGGPHPLQARVRLVEPAAFTKVSALGVEEQRVYVRADILEPLERRATLGDAYRVDARIVTWQSDNVLKVPAGALFQRNARWQTYVLAGNHARLREVKVGQGNGYESEILDGLAAGEQVIVYPGDNIADGVRVTTAADLKK